MYRPFEQESAQIAAAVSGRFLDTVLGILIVLLFLVFLAGLRRHLGKVVTGPWARSGSKG